MNTPDVSHLDQYAAYLRQIEQNVERAKQRKGQLVRDHPPPQQIISKFTMNLLAHSLFAESQKNMIATSQVPYPYPPCVRPANELQPMMISDMRLETHHRRRSVLLRVRTPPNRMTAVMAIAEDEQGTAVLLQLYFQPPESVLPAIETVQPDNVCILKEPFFKCATDGSYSLRVDHLSDLLWLEDSDSRIPSRWRKLAPTGVDSKGLRLKGNDAVQKQNWAEAQRLYSSAIRTAKTVEEEQLAYLNRSLTNLRVGRPEQALSDASRGYDDASPSEKGLFREARALYELGNFERCLEKLKLLSDLHPQNTASKPEMSRVMTRLHEQQTGEYDFHQIYRQAKRTPPLIDCATFSTPVEIRSSTGRGKGLFTTMPISAGQLLLCEKAFAYHYTDADDPAQLSILMNIATKRASMGGQAHLLTQLVQKLYHSPQALRSYNELHRGDYIAPQVSNSDGYPVVDSFMVEQIRTLNSFGAPRTTRELCSNLYSNSLSRNLEDEKFTTCGIWLLASRINHSCVGNCRRSFIGDIQVIRASRDLEANSELFFGYRSTEKLESYEKVQKDLGAWGFTCACELCVSRKATSRPMLERRKSLFKDLTSVLGDSRAINIAQATRLLAQIEQTYPTTGTRTAIELWDPYCGLGALYLSIDEPAKAIAAIVKGFESIGYSITACPPIGDAKVPQLKVNKWGPSNDFTPLAFLTLFRAYQRLAPELCATAKRYIRVAYSIAVGEEETLLDEFPELR